MEIHLSLKEASDLPDKSSYIFQGSKGWLQRYQSYYDLVNRKVKGEAASAHKDTAAHYPGEFARIISDGGYLNCRVFN